MTLIHLFLVAVIQGITEFLPISSSGHLILLPALTGMEDQGQVIDVSVHVGTLLAVVIYFWADVKIGLLGLPNALRGRITNQGDRLALGLIIGTIPVVIIGLILNVTGLDEAMRSVAVIGWTMLIFGIVLYWADQKGPVEKDETDWTPMEALKMGLWQAVALIPGTSRSGITITGARFMGYNRHDAAKLSMLMSIPTIMASGLLLGIKVAGQANNAAVIHDAAIAAALAFFSALLALTIMMRLLRSVSFTPYVIYRIVFGVCLLAYAYL